MSTTPRFASIMAAVAASMFLVGVPAVAVAETPADPFEDSYWTTPIETDAPIHPMSKEIIDFLVADNDLDGCITLAGGEGNDWGMPIFTGDAETPVHEVLSRKYDVPPEFAALRIPDGARPADNSDGEMVIYDTAAGLVAQLSKAEYDSSSDSWSVNGGSVVYLDSNGLYGDVVGSDDERNRGTFRGYSGAVAAVHYDDVAAGQIGRVHKVSIDNANEGHIFPFNGSDGDLGALNVPLQGARIRIKPGVDLQSKGLAPQALTIARGLQEYGLVVGDSSGGAIVLMLEDTVRSGRGALWNLDRESLCAIKGDDLEVVLTGFADVVDTTFEMEALRLLEERITFGCGKWDFCPNDPITRAQMAAFLVRALALPGPTGDDRFVDDNSSIFELDIESLAQAGITRGCNPPANDQFCPSSAVTRGQMAAFLVRALGYNDDGGRDLFVDDDSSPFELDIDKLSTAGVTRGCNPPDNDEFCPNQTVTRGQMAAFLVRALFPG